MDDLVLVLLALLFSWILDGLVLASRGDTCAVGTEVHTENQLGMPLEGCDFPACFDVPHLDRIVPGSLGDPRAVGAETEGLHRRFTSLERSDFSARDGIPYPD